MKTAMLALVTIVVVLCCAITVIAGVSPVRVLLSSQSNRVVQNVAQVLTWQISQRCETQNSSLGQSPPVIDLAIEPGIGKEGFKIVDGARDTVRIAGNDERGLLYGVGTFLRTSQYDRGRFTAGKWRGKSVPEKPVRNLFCHTQSQLLPRRPD